MIAKALKKTLFIVFTITYIIVTALATIHRFKTDTDALFIRECNSKVVRYLNEVVYCIGDSTDFLIEADTFLVCFFSPYQETLPIDANIGEAIFGRNSNRTKTHSDIYQTVIGGQNYNILNTLSIVNVGIYRNYKLCKIQTQADNSSIVITAYFLKKY